MNKDLQAILNFVQQSEHLSDDERKSILKSLKDANKEIEITAFKLDRTEKVKRTTAILLEETIEELEQKRKAVEAQNKELEIESSLERVRTVAMAMQQPGNLLDICEMLFIELGKLGFHELRNTMINIHYDERNFLLNYDYAAATGKTVTNVPYNFHPVVNKQMEVTGNIPDAFYEFSLVGEELKEFRELRKKNGEQDDPKLEITDALYYYFYSIGTGSIGISTYSSIVGEKLDLLKRFRNVFNLSYQRYTDISLAEAQTREAQVELALERVRARTMAMQKQNDLLGVLDLLVEQLVKLGVNLHVANFSNGIPGGDWDLWIEVVADDGTIFNNYVHFPRIEHPYFHHVEKNIETYRKDGTNLFKDVFSKEEKDSWQHYINTQTIYKDLTPEDIRQSMYEKPGYTWSMVILKDSWVSICRFNTIPFSDEEDALLRRFANAFGQTYTRFLDLQKAEAQARESQIELGLERVRAKAMAMQNSEELNALIGTVFTELTKLDLVLTRCVIIIYDTKTNGGRWWMANSEAPSEPMNFLVKHSEHPPSVAYLKAWQQRTLKWEYPLQGAIKKEWDDFLFSETELSQLPDFVISGMKAPDKVYLNASFNNFGNLTLASLEPLSEEHFGIMLRFAKVFDLTYTRFNDLQKSEAQARESQIQLGLERVRARTMAMQNSNELADIVDTVFKELTKLHFALDRCIIMIYDPKTLGSTWWLANPEPGSVSVGSFVKYHEHKPYLDYIDAWKNKVLKWQYLLEGDSKKEWDEFIFNKTDLSLLPEFVINGMRSFEQIFLNVSFNNFGSITVSSVEPLQEEHFDILLRFAKVFDSTYTRFNDLKQAEAQARESQIQLGLERVRARAMAMQRSDELAEAATVLFQQVKALGISQWTCGFNIWEPGDKEFTFYPGSPDGDILPPCFNIPLTVDPVFILFDESRKRGDELCVYESKGENQETHYRYMLTVPGGLGAYLQTLLDHGVQFPDFQIDHIANFSNGNLLFITYEHFPEMHDIFKRFAKVFEQTYTRFLDLQKAESQARESQVQLALERVRAKTMAMHHSNELAETSSVLFQQIKELGFETWSCGFCIWTKNDMAELWMGADSGGLLPPMMIPYKEETTHHDIFEAFLEKKPAHHKIWEGKALEQHYTFLNTIPSVKIAIEQLEKAGQSLPAKQCYYVGFFKQGYLLLITKEPNAALEDLSKRFASVFDLTYTRFLDLQRAETQAREAQIEAALERVRSRSMAMQKSEELSEVIQVVYNQFTHLDIPAEHTGFVMDYKTKDDYKLWIADRFGSPSQVTIPYFDSIYYNSFNKAKEIGDDFFITTLSFEEKNKFYEELFKHVPELPEESQEIIFNAPGYSISTVLLENVSLYIENFTGIPFSDEENAILIRFGKVFQQTYTRFLDLQRAEVQALEAIKRASVDRVRAEIASMRTTNDLERITPLIWNELTTLGVPFIRCGVFIMDDEKQEVQTFLYTEGKAIASFTSTFSNSTLIIEALPYWRRKEIYKTHWDEAAFLEQARNLVEQGSITSGEKYLTEHRPTDLWLHFLPFLQGMLYVGDAASLSNEHLQLVQALAEAFSTAYARYEDFNKLEFAKKQVDSTLTELQATQKQLIQSEKMASLGELTAGIAHEIQNPLNFVNNFSEVSRELIEELKSQKEKLKPEEQEELLNDIDANLEKINHHGKRADAIVKGMLQHSRSTGNEKQPTDINALADEYLRLAYHGLRAKDKSFNATLVTDYDETIGKINIIPQDIGRVILNVITNAFYTVNEKKKVQGNSYEPTVSIITKKNGDSIEIKIVDNGNGIPQKIVDKIFQPFFTTKPTGQGTGLGLSLAYDIVKAHGGELKVETKEGEGSEFIIQIPNTI